MEKEVKLFGFSVSSWPKWLILLVGISGIFVSFLAQGIAQESIYSKYNFKETLFFTFVQFFGYFLFSSGFFFKLIRKKETLHCSVRYYSFTSFCLCLSMGLSNLTIEFLSYPTAVLFKSSKIIPVMIGSIIFLKKRYNLIEICSVVLMTFGLIGISYSDKVSKNQFNIIGVILALLSLISDAFASNLQDKALNQKGASQNEVISMMYLIGSIITFFVSLFSGQLFTGIQCCIQHPSINFYIFCFAFLGSVGVQFVYLIMKVFGSLVTVTVTSVRKAMTVCLSFLLFPNKKFTKTHMVSILLIFVGLVLNYIGKRRNKFNQNRPQEKPQMQKKFADEQSNESEDEKVVKHTAVKGN